jgi:hypothetical protein
VTSFEIVLLFIGLACVVVSFVMGGDKAKPEQPISTELNQAQKEAIRKQVQSIIDEEVITASEKTEVSLDKISNTKILEMNEYAENVLGQINRNHNETVFLYDMLNEKAKEVKTTVKDVNVTRRQVEKIQAEVANDVLAASREREAQPGEDKASENALLGRSQVEGLEADVAGTSLVEPQPTVKAPTAAKPSATAKKAVADKPAAGTRQPRAAKPSATAKSSATAKAEDAGGTDAVPKKSTAQIVKPGTATKPATQPKTARQKKKPGVEEEVPSFHSSNVAKERVRKVVESDESELDEDVNHTGMSEEDKMDAAILAAKGEKMASSATRKNARRAKAEAVPAMDDDSQAVKTANNNERVLKLFKEGKNSRDIAKELNLGVGEVQLVIDLYNSTK